MLDFLLVYSGDIMKKLLDYEELMIVRRWHLLNHECFESHYNLEANKDDPDLKKLRRLKKEMKTHHIHMAKVDTAIKSRYHQAKVGEDGFRILNS